MKPKINIIKGKLRKSRIISIVWWYFTRNVLPKGESLNLHLGCGEIDYPGFINIDRYPYKHVHYLKDVQRLSLFKNNSVDLIYISHCLEHFSYLKIPGILKEYFRVLKPEGILRISVPDFDNILTIYRNERTIESIEGYMMGGHDYKYNFHYSFYNFGYLRNLLSNTGFKEVRKWKYNDGPFTDLPDWSGRMVRSKEGKLYEISLNIEAIK